MRLMVYGTLLGTGTALGKIIYIILLVNEYLEQMLSSTGKRSMMMLQINLLKESCVEGGGEGGGVKKCNNQSDTSVMRTLFSVKIRTLREQQISGNQPRLELEVANQDAADIYVCLYFLFVHSITPKHIHIQTQ